MAARANHFDFLRLFAAGMVLFGHAHPLSGAPSPGLLGNSVQTVGVKIFFVISGYLISLSWTRDPSVARFAQRRALRILPGLWLVVAASALLLGPAMTELPLGEYFASRVTWNYFENAWLHIVYALPGVFAHNTYPNAVNGSLWSLPAETSMYVLVPLVVGGPRGRGARTVAATVACAAVGLWAVRVAHVSPGPVVYNLALVSLSDVAPYFLLGALFAVLPIAALLDARLALPLLVGAFYARGPEPLVEGYLMVVLPVVVLWLALHAPLHMEWVGRRGDLSYGVYLYGFPIQQALNHVLGRQSPLVNFLEAAPLTLLGAFASWHLVEKRALEWKPRR